MLGVEAASAGVEVCGRFCQEAASQGTVGVEMDAEFLQRGEKGFFRMARHWVVVALVDSGKWEAFCFGDVVHLLDLLWAEIAQSEASEDTLLVHFVDALELPPQTGCWCLVRGSRRRRIA